jgi:bifunctional non-homologous end joining protein LigD
VRGEVETPQANAHLHERSKGMTSGRRSVGAPDFVPPMRALLVNKLPVGPEWMYEVKWDGYRALAAKHGDNVRLLSLKNKDLATTFPAVVAAVKTIQAGTVLLDGEIVAVNSEGLPSFQALQSRGGGRWHILYYAFDLLSVEGEDLKALPLEKRKEKLKTVLRGSDVRLSDELPGTPADIVPTLKAAQIEGVIAKRRDSFYAGRTRSLAWQKLKLSPAQEFVVGGYNPDGESFSSLLVGYHANGQLMFAGKVRQGLNPSLRRALLKGFKALVSDRCPFVNLPLSKSGHFGEGISKEDMEGLQWLEPQLVAQVSFTEWTSSGLLRHASFLGLRGDKDPEEVVMEQASE